MAERLELVVATGNPDKAREFAHLLRSAPLTLRNLSEFPPVPPVVEDGATLAANARMKAATYAAALRRWALADDTGLEVDVLGGAPGVRSARFAGPQASMEENRVLLLRQLERRPEPWTARFVCRLAVADPSGAVVLEAEGECRGRIRRKPAGEFGFGYDTLFEVEGTPRTLAEMNAEETDEAGHRGRAVRALLANWPDLAVPPRD